MDDLRKPDVITVAVSRVDGGLTVLKIITTEYRPADEYEQKLGLVRVANWTIDPTSAYIESIIKKHNWTGPLAPVSWRVVPNDFAANEDRTFRNTWKDNHGHKPEVDMPKAREIHKNRLRNARVELLEQLDIDYQRADEVGNNLEKQRISREKQRLRDVTVDLRIEAAQTPEELKAIWPL